MTEFLKLSKKNKELFFRMGGAKNEGIAPAILEKDLWMCQVMRSLFGNRESLPMVFKGGTSLSKIYKAIDRFSEDIDISIDFCSLLEWRGEKCDIENISIKKKDEKLKRLKEYVTVYIQEVILPQLTPDVEACGGEVKLPEDDNETVLISYPSLSETLPYIKSQIRLEFGGRNFFPDPVDRFTIASYAERLAEMLNQSVKFPVALNVPFLSAERKLMEKATLIHCLCYRHAEGKLRMENRDRFFRHWYDLARLVSSVDGIGIRSMNQRELLEEVVTHKMIFFSEAPEKYEKCLQGEMHLVPEGTLLNALKKDYEDMEKNHMFFKGKEIPPLGDILQKAKVTEDTINRNEKHYKKINLFSDAYKSGRCSFLPLGICSVKHF